MSNVYREPSYIAPVEPDQERIVLDVSEYQGDINWDELATDERVIGVILRATFGNAGVDRKFERNLRESLRVGLFRGTYHFADPDRRTDDAKAEARHYITTVVRTYVKVWSVIAMLSPQVLYTLDIEKVRDLDKGPAFCDWVLDFCEECDRMLACKYVTGIYTGGPFWDAHDGEPTDEQRDRLTHRWLWIAAYVNDPTRYVKLTPWRDKGASLHQISGDVSPGGKPGRRFPGITANVVDTNVFLADGTFDDWIASRWIDDKPIEYPRTDVVRAEDTVRTLADTEPVPAVPDGSGTGNQEPNT